MGKGQNLYNEAKKIIPGGTQLLSKRPEMFLPDLWPAYYSRAKGCEVWDLDGNHYYDVSLMGVGACVHGYANDEIDEAAKKAIDKGSMCTLNAPEEVELAQTMIRLHPWADSVRYAKAGGEGMALATRIARAATGKDIVLVCGYHGWHDWYLAANLVKGDPLADVHLKGLDPAGVPRGMAGTNLIFHYNNIEEFNALVENNRGNIAAVIMEPIRNDYPQDGFLDIIRETTRRENIALVFDEITAGFRLCPGGSHLKLGVNPDIAVFAKAMTNGYPLSVIIGIGEYMDAAQNTFISSTFFTERIGFAATLKALELYESNNVHEYINHIGEYVQHKWKEIAEKHGVEIEIGGIYPLSHFGFTGDKPLEYKTYFTQEMLKEGFLASNAFYMSYAHTDEIIEKYLIAFERTITKIASINDNKKDIKEFIGTCCHSGFERLL